MLKEEFKSPKIDFKKFVELMAGGCEILRAYYYDCLPYQSSPPTPDERVRFGKKQSFLNYLEHLPRFEVRLGKLEYRGLDERRAPVFEQKRVDILICVDLALLAAKHQISDAVIFAGDSDFLPAIEAAKREGVVVHLYHGSRPHHDLIKMCDERTQMTQSMIDSIASQAPPLPIPKQAP